MEGIPDYLKLFKRISDRVLVLIFEQGSPPHPNHMDRLFLYVKVGDRFVQMGKKISNPQDIDIKKWVQMCLSKRIQTREKALNRLSLEIQEQQKERASLRDAQRDVTQALL